MEIEVNGITLYYEVQGRGRPLILLHGNGEDHTIFEELTACLAGEYRVYAVDSRDHGRSSRMARISYGIMASDVTALIETLQLQGAVLYGFSDGGIVGLLVAAERPELLSGLIVSGANLDPGGLKPSFLWRMRLEYLLKRDRKTGMMLREPDISPEKLKRIKIPVLVTAGEKDLIREEHTRMIAANIPGSSLKIFPGETHGSYVVHSGRMAPVIRGFLTEKAEERERRREKSGEKEKKA
jgi:pimeloyl-ACP methyl ester carboxylesterase